ncbi:MAG: CBS domain-containing protein [Candidatus Syntrophoarchaeum sp. WYZ-LMO15]|nr:MAG: CBS domain-containing protein [Candidatus Syntrophoarchaeum sp. WYZ-LMO15]
MRPAVKRCVNEVRGYGVGIKEIAGRAISLREDEYLTKARQIIRDNELRVLPVVDENEMLLGVITDEDVLKLSATKSNVTVKGFIREVHAADIDEDLHSLARRMIEDEVDEIPVTENGRLVGILNLRDILRAIPYRRSDKLIGSIMTRKVKTLRSDDPITIAVSNMAEYGYSGFPVLDDKGKLVGIVTRRDLIRARSKVGKEHPPPAVKSVMTTTIHAVSPDTRVHEAVEMMLKFDIGRLPVTEDGKLIGIVDRYDLIKAVIE